MMRSPGTNIFGAMALTSLLAGCIQQPADSPDETPKAQPAPVAVVQAPTTAAEPAPAAAAEPAESQESAKASPEPATSNAPSPDQEGNILIDPMAPGVWNSPLGSMSTVQEGGKDILRYVTENPGEKEWSLHTCMSNVVIVNGRKYKLILDARSGDPQMDSYAVTAITQANGGDYQGTGLWRGVNLTKQWKKHELTFVGAKADENLSRLCLDPQNVPGIIDIRSVSIKPVK